jgi:hypothetical protein
LGLLFGPPTAENEPNVTPVAVGTADGSVLPVLVVTLAKSYVFEKVCAFDL